MKKTVSILALVLLLAGCNLSPFHDNFSKEDGKEVLAKATFKEETIDSMATVEVYASMSPGNRFKRPDALLYYSDPFKELYTLVFRQTRADFNTSILGEKDLLEKSRRDGSSAVGLYGDYVADEDAHRIEDGQYNLLGEKKLHNLNFRSYSITGHLGKMQLFYLVGVYESPHYFHQVVVWTLASRRDLYEGIMTKMIESLRENPTGTLQ
ncbi:MAG TPA: hypothetical protein VLD19_19845 [Chitinophagaceae bacterium]|nr:hypothetical protein [Chitinophagaceae bacterium]